MPDNLIQVGATVDLSELKALVNQSDEVSAAYKRLAQAQIEANNASKTARSTLNALATGELPMVDSVIKDYAKELEASKKASEALKVSQGDLNVILGRGGAAAEEVSKKTVDVRHSIGLLDNTIRGAHGQAMADVIRLFGTSGVVMAALPIAATAAGFALLGGFVYEGYQNLKEHREELEKLTDDETRFSTVVNNVFDNLNDKLLRAQIKADELNDDHLGALKKQLELIDHQSMDELVQRFQKVATAADKVFADLKSHWYTLGTGSDGAKHDLEQFQVQYESLLAQGKQGEANDLLKGTLASAQKVLAAQKELTVVNTHLGDVLHGEVATEEQARYAQSQKAALQAQFLQQQRASNVLAAAHVGHTKEEIAAREQLIAALQAQLGVEGKISQITSATKNEAIDKYNKMKIVDATHLAGAHSKIAAEIKKENEAAVQTGPLLARLWQTAGNEARKYLDTIRAGYEGEIELAGVNEQATEAILAAQLAKHKISKNQEVLAVRDAKLKELKEEQDYLKAIQSLYAQGTKEWQDYQNRLNLIHAQALKIRANAEAQTAKATDIQYKQLFNSMGHSFKGFVDSVLVGNQTIAQDFQQLYAGLILALVNYLEQEAVEWLAHYLTKHLLHKTDAVSTITDDAATGGASAYASVMAALPFPANVATAPGVAATTSAAIEAFTAGLASFDIGSNFVPMTGLAMVHRGEQIIPANQQGPGYSGAGLQIHFNISATDGQDAARFIMKNSRSIANAITKELRKKGMFSA